jgi:hypothetical protein
MAMFHPLPLGARVQQTLILLVATCLVSLAVATCVWARTAQPTATTSSTVLHRALVARAADKRLFAHRSSMLTICSHTRSSHCASQRRMVAQSRTKLAHAEELVNSLSARIARRHHSSISTHTPSGDSIGAGGGKGNSAKGGSTNESSHGTGTSGDSPTGLGAGNESSIGSPGSPEGSPGEGSSSPSSTFSEPFVKGIVTNIQGWGTSAMPQISSEMSSLGVNWAREDLSWADTEPHKGVFDWSGFDQMVSAAKAKGITVLPIVGYAPSWAAPGDATDYSAFMQAAVERYGPGTSANLIWWELWNEPYDAYAWSGHTPEPEAYARDVLAAAQAARRVSSSVKLLVAADYNDSPQAGGTTPWQTSWIDDMFTAVPSLGEWINGVAVHPYGDDPSQPLAQTNGWKDSSGEWAFQRIDVIRQKFLAHGVNVPFWITEDGWSTWEMSEATQAHDYSDLIEQVKDRPWIRGLFPFCLREFEEKATNNQPGFGLLKFGTWQPKPAFYTLQAGLKTLS